MSDTHTCSLGAILNGHATDDGFECAHGWRIHPGDTIHDEKGQTWTIDAKTHQAETCPPIRIVTEWPESVSP